MDKIEVAYFARIENVLIRRRRKNTGIGQSEEGDA
jgi:hypothetical protein